MKSDFSSAESTEMSGKCVVALATGDGTGSQSASWGAHSQSLNLVWEMTRHCYLSRPLELRGSDSWLGSALNCCGAVWSRAFVWTQRTPAQGCGAWLSHTCPSRSWSLSPLPMPTVLTTRVPTDPGILSLSGKVLPSCDLARRYGLKDVDGECLLWAGFTRPLCSLLLSPTFQPELGCPRRRK